MPWTAFEGLRVVGDELRFMDCDGLRVVDGINNLETVTKSIYFVENSSLELIQGFESLKRLASTWMFLITKNLFGLPV